MTEVLFNPNTILNMGGTGYQPGGLKNGEIAPRMRLLQFDEQRMNSCLNMKEEDTGNCIQRGQMQDPKNFSIAKGDVLHYIKLPNDPTATRVLSTVVGYPFDPAKKDNGRRDLERRLVIPGISVANVFGTKVHKELGQTEISGYRSGAIDCVINNGQKTIYGNDLVIARVPEISKDGNLSGYSNKQRDGYYPLLIEPLDTSSLTVKRTSQELQTELGFDAAGLTANNIGAFKQHVRYQSEYQTLVDIGLLQLYGWTLADDTRKQLLEMYETALERVNNSSFVKRHGFENLVIGTSFGKALPDDHITLHISHLLQ